MANRYVTGPAKCGKAVLVAFNILFLIVGICILSIGVYVMSGGPLSNASFLKAWKLPIALITVGGVITLMSLIGVCGATRNHKGLLKAYAALLVVLILVEIGLGATAGRLSSTDKIETFLNDGWSTTAQEERNDIEKAFKCCGFKNASEAVGVEADVCKNGTASPDSETHGWKDGCYWTLYDAFHNALRFVYIGAAVAAAAQFIGILLAFWLWRNIEDGSSYEPLWSKGQYA